MFAKILKMKQVKLLLATVIIAFIVLIALIAAFSSYRGLFDVLPSAPVGFLIACYLLLIPISAFLIHFTNLPLFLAKIGFVGRALILLVCWSPFLLGFYPGNLWYHDTCFQICQFFGNEMPNIFATLPGYSITDHHPILDTAIFGLFIQFGKVVFNSENIGYFLFIMMQAIVTSLVFSYGIQRCILHGVSKRLSAWMVVFLGLCPIFPFSVGSMAKDMLNAPFFLIFCFIYADIVTSRSVSKKQMIMLIPLALFVSLTKKTSLYIVIIAFAIAMLRVMGTNKMKLLSVAAIIVLINSLFIPKIIFPIFNVSPGSSIEALALPIQQVSRAVIDEPDLISSGERGAIDDLIGFDTIPERFNPISSDGVKGIGSDRNVDYYPSTTKLLNFVKSWATVGLKAPSSYIKAALELESGWFSLSFKPTWFNMLHESGLPIQPPNGAVLINRPAYIQHFADVIADTWFSLGNISPINLFFTPFIYCIVIPVLVTLGCIIKHKDLMPLIPILLSAVVLFLSPVSVGNESIRYALPLIYSSVFLIAYLFSAATRTTRTDSLKCSH